jgi:hypothetical protein
MRVWPPVPTSSILCALSSRSAELKLAAHQFRIDFSHFWMVLKLIEDNICFLPLVYFCLLDCKIACQLVTHIQDWYMYAVYPRATDWATTGRQVCILDKRIFNQLLVCLLFMYSWYFAVTDTLIHLSQQLWGYFRQFLNIS